MNMKIKDISIDFLSENMSNIELEQINLTNEIINEVRNLLDDFIFCYYDEEDEEDAEKKHELEEALKKLEGTDDKTAYNIYCNLSNFDYREDEPIIELYKKREEQLEYLENINVLANKFYNIIKNSFSEFDDVKISFSSKSPSVYLTLPIAATEENVEEVFENIEYNRFEFSTSNVYEEDEDYNEAKNIEIRLSDHDFGGWTRFDGYGDYVSYRRSCINLFYRF